MEFLNRFSNNLKSVLVNAMKLASDLGHQHVEPFHFFFCLNNQKGSISSEILKKYKIDPKSLEEFLIQMPGFKKGNTKNKSAVDVIVPFSESSKTILENAVAIAYKSEHNFVGTEHLLLSLVESPDTSIQKLFEINNIDIKKIIDKLYAILDNDSQFPKITELNKNNENGDFPNLDSLGMPPMPLMMNKNKQNDSALEVFATNLTNKKAQENIDPVIGRYNEIERIIQIISRRTKNNPVLLGDPGVGKTAIAEGLAKKIVEGDVPDILLNKKIYSLDMGLLVAGTIYRGEFESRLKQVIDEIISDPDIILFIDEMHNIVGAGSSSGTMDAANILKPALARGQIRCIGSTTPGEFKKHIENDPALERRFQAVYVDEPSLKETEEILKGLKKNYEIYHKIKISDSAVESAVELSNKYIHNKFLPDKAIDLLDETAASKTLKTKNNSNLSKLARLKRQLAKVISEKETAASQDNFEKAVELKNEQIKLEMEIIKNEKNNLNKKIKYIGEITESDVIEQLAKILKIDAQELKTQGIKKWEKLEKNLKQKIVGQNETISEITNLICQHQLGLSNINKPLASFMLVGESGVGKTETAKTLAKLFYPNTDALVKLNMSEFSESFSTSKILGSPAGYVGYKEENPFVDKIKRNPHCVILLDEIDKAHKDVLKLMLQMLDEGELSSAMGKKISLKHAIIIMTTSYSSEQLKKGEVGFGENTSQRLASLGLEKPTKNTNKLVTEKLKEFFSPELINRIDKVCILNSLTPENLGMIAKLELEDLNKNLKNHHTEIETTLKTLESLAKNEKQKNAREIKQFLRTELEKLIAERILQPDTKAKYTLTYQKGKVQII